MLNVNDPSLQEACFHIVQRLVLGSEEQQREIAREILLAATEFMCRVTEPDLGSTDEADEARESSAATPKPREAL